MKKLLLFIFSIFLFFPNSTLAASGEKIDSFSALYNLRSDGIIEVTETINYNFGANERHGIEKWVPYRYKDKNGQVSYLNLSDFSLKDQNGSNYQFQKRIENDHVIFKIGDPNRTINGPHTYVIKYKVKGALRYFDQGEEFYWNVTGNSWQIPIEKITAEVRMDKSLKAEKVNINCFSGGYGLSTPCVNKEKIASVGGSDVSGAKFTENVLSAGEGLTIVFGVPKGTFPVVTAGFLGSGLTVNQISALVLIAFGLIFLTFLFMLRHYWKWGRDPKGRGTVIAEYEPPKDLTPSQIGTLLDFRVDGRDISSEIIYLASKGYLKIRREKQGVLKKDEYYFIKKKDFTGGGFDQRLFIAIFKNLNEVKLSDLKTNFYEQLQDIKSGIQGSLVQKGYFRESVGWVLGKYLGIAGGLLTIGFFILIFSLSNPTVIVFAIIFGLALMFCGLIVGAFGLFMPARTAEGVAVKEKILGFKNYLSVAEKDRLKFHNAPTADPKKFEEYLPFAMALSVEKEWAKQFEGIYKGQPSWYQDSTGAAFHPIYFASAMNSFNTSVSHNMVAPPTSSDSGLSGGGFSGGGFGGGGGGSW